MTNVPRRQFLKTSVAAAALPLASEGLGQSHRKGIKKALKFGMVKDGKTVLEKFRLVKELGYDGIELDSPNNLDNAEVLAARDATELPIHGVVDSVHWGKPFSHPDEKVRNEGLEGLLTAIRDAKAYGASSVLVVPAVVNKGITYGDAYRRSQEMIRKALPLATELQIRIAFENVWNNFLLSPVEMGRYIDEFESPLVGCYFDVGNIVRYGWPTHWVEELRHRVMKIDVKGYSRNLQNKTGPWSGFRVELDEGDCQWKEVMELVTQHTPAEWATAEVGGGGRDRLADILKRMRAALDQ